MALFPTSAGDAVDRKNFFSREKKIFPFPRAPFSFQEKRDFLHLLVAPQPLAEAGGSFKGMIEKSPHMVNRAKKQVQHLPPESGGIK